MCLTALDCPEKKKIIETNTQGAETVTETRCSNVHILLINFDVDFNNYFGVM